MKRFGYSLTILLTAALCQGVPVSAHYEEAADAAAKSKTGQKDGKKKSVSKKISNSHLHSHSDPWDLLGKAVAPVYAAGASVNIFLQGDARIVKSNGLPDHQTGAFPNPGNPNSISEQSYMFRVPRNPAFATRTTALRMNLFGVAVNGVPFDPMAAEWWNRDPSSGWQYEAMSLGPRLGLDQNNAHVQPNGAYHYHGLPTGLVAKLGQYNRPILLGYAADGFPIYGPYGHSDSKQANSTMKKLKSSYRVKHGTRPGGPGGQYDGTFVQDYEYVANSGDLDDCNGRFDVTVEYPKGTYLYVITDSYPYIPRGFKGTPDVSFLKGPPGGQRGFGPPGIFAGGPGGGPGNGNGFGFGPPPGGFGQGPGGGFALPSGFGSGQSSAGFGDGQGPGGSFAGGWQGQGGGFGPPPGLGLGGGQGPPGGFGGGGQGPGGGFGPPGGFGGGQRQGGGQGQGGDCSGGGGQGPRGGFGGSQGPGSRPGGNGPGGNGPGGNGSGPGGGFGPPGGPGGGPPGGGFGGPQGGGFGGPQGGGFGGPPAGGFGVQTGAGFGGPPGGGFGGGQGGGFGRGSGGGCGGD